MLKEKIESKLKALIGLELSGTARAANMEGLKFGSYRKMTKIGKVDVGEFSLHVQCEWRIIRANKMLIASNDLYEPKKGEKFSENFDYEKGNLRDTEFRGLIANNNLLVEKIEADEIGGLTLYFSGDYQLQVIPLNTSKTGYNEYWRLLNNVKEKSKDFVISVNGVEKN